MPAICALLAPLVAGAAPAAAAPRVLSVDLRGGVVGQSSLLIVRARNDSAPVSGHAVRFGRRTPYQTSACRAPIPFPPDVAVRIAAPLAFSRLGSIDGVIRVDSGYCGGLSTSIFQPMKVKPRRPGDRPAQPVLGVPTAGPSHIAFPAARSCSGGRRRLGRSRKARRQAVRALLCLINRERRRRGRSPLRTSPRLSRAAASHARAMVRRHFFSHIQPGGVDLVTRLRRVHYLPARSWFVGENIAAATGRLSSPAVQMRGWMHSSGHRANILNANFRQVGIGVAAGTPSSRRGGTYATDFGVRR